jgi:hypothetical protein
VLTLTHSTPSSIVGAVLIIGRMPERNIYVNNQQPTSLKLSVVHSGTSLVSSEWKIAWPIKNISLLNSTVDFNYAM